MDEKKLLKNNKKYKYFDKIYCSTKKEADIYIDKYDKYCIYGGSLKKLVDILILDGLADVDVNCHYSKANGINKYKTYTKLLEKEFNHLRVNEEIY